MVDQKKALSHVIGKYWKELLCFLVPPLLMLAYNLIRDGQFVLLYPDARMYLSIADNFLSTGHFQETTRGGNYVVSFGFPLVLTVFRAVRLGSRGIVALQYLMLGGTCLLLYKTEENILGKGGIAPAAYFLMLLFIRLNVRNLYVEHYYLLVLVCILWLLSRREMPPEKRLLWLNAAGFAAFALRTVLITVYIPIVIYSFICRRKRELSGARLALFILLPAVILGANTAVNHRETGYWIMTDNYSGVDMYLANNPATKTSVYVTERIPEFTDAAYDAVQSDPSLDFTGRNAKLKEMAMDWIRQNPGVFARNTAKKFVTMFVTHWRGLLLLALLCGTVWAIRTKTYYMLTAAGAALLLAAVTSMGLVVYRYTEPVIPLAALQLAAGWDLLRQSIKKLDRS